MARTIHKCQRLCGEHVERLKKVFKLAKALGYTLEGAKYHAVRAVERYRQGGWADFTNKCYALKRGTAKVGKHFKESVEAYDRLIAAKPVPDQKWLGGSTLLKTLRRLEAKRLDPKVPAPKENEIRGD